ncbi:MAG: SUMF1/EgtB/PvdO family nonheme iron enzyme [Fusobacteriota bacterium]
MIKKFKLLILVLIILNFISCSFLNEEETKVSDAEKSKQKNEEIQQVEEVKDKEEIKQIEKDELEDKSESEPKEKSMEFKNLILETSSEKKEIIANNSDEIEFEILDEEKKGISHETLSQSGIRLYKNDQIYSNYKFSSDKPGKYNFYAKYNDIKSNEITISVKKKTKEITELKIKSNSKDNIIIADGKDKIRFEYLDQDGESIDPEKVKLYRNDEIYTEFEFRSTETGEYDVYAKYNNIKSNTITVKVEKVDQISPKLLESSIKNNSKISPTKPINLYFSEEIDIEEIQEKITLKSNDRKLEIEIKKEGATLEVIPKNISYNTKYELNISDNIYDMSENKLEKGKRIIFSTINLIKTSMSTVESGKFEMGDEKGDLWDEHRPVHTVEITYDFNIGRYEVTNEIYNFYLKENDINRDPITNDRKVQKPIVNITWNDAINYCNWLSEAEEIPKAYNSKGNLINRNGEVTDNLEEVYGYRLPTEAEWEYAARGGTKSKDYLYSGSNDPKQVAIFSEQTSTLYEVGTKKSNELGLYDMSGNVWEWCYDGYKEYDSSRKINPVGIYNSDYRIIRGGSWRSVKYEIRNASRDSFYPSIENDEIGFRIVKTVID